ncbi:hypothetical protein C8T65DRAFT_636889 [Cerioporus squamosus]|nr:hypothetical protein C8T65DRAFT_636889 [Cerioporus squamosus]
MDSRTSAIQSTSDVTSNVPFWGCTSATKEDWISVPMDGFTDLLSEGLPGLEQLRCLESRLPVPASTTDLLDLKADPVPLSLWKKFYTTLEETGPARLTFQGSATSAGASGSSLQLSDEFTTSPSCSSDGGSSLRAAFVQLSLDEHPPLAIAAVDPLSSNTLNEVPGSGLSFSDSLPPSFAPSPLPLSSPFHEVVAPPADSGYDSPHQASSPTPRRKLGKQRAARRHVPYPCPSPDSSPSPSRSSPHLPLPPLAALRLKTSPRRNKQVRASASPPSSSPASSPSPDPGSSESETSSPSKSRTCMHCKVTFPRMTRAELRRHEGTHQGEQSVMYWVCTGVPFELVRDYVPNDEAVMKLIAEGRTMLYEGLYMVGGCGQGVSRRDALARHLKEMKGKCLGSHKGPWLLGNKQRAKK